MMNRSISNPHRSDADVASAMALLGSGLSSVQVSEVTGIPARTLRDWQRSPELAAKYRDAIKAARTRIAMRTSQLAERVLDDIEDGTVKVSPVQAFTMWGISTDKVQKDEPQQASDAPPQPFAIFIKIDADSRPASNAEADVGDTIEGTAREVDE